VLTTPWGTHELYEDLGSTPFFLVSDPLIQEAWGNPIWHYMEAAQDPRSGSWSSFELQQRALELYEQRRFYVQLHGASMDQKQRQVDFMVMVVGEAALMFSPVDETVLVLKVLQWVRGPNGKCALRTITQLFRRGKGPATRGGPTESLTGQYHHAVGTKIHRATEAHPNLTGQYQARDSRFVTQAKDAPSHRGYQHWHRDLDNEVIQWIQRNPQATTADFETFLRQRYSQPDLLDRFPNGLDLEGPR
jgi:hypothetical protein